jgi:hypothetical protein
MTGAAIPGIVAASRRRTSPAALTVLGFNTKGGTAAGLNSAGMLHVSQFALASPGTLKELHGFFKGDTPSTSVRVVIYKDDGAGGLPGTRLAYTASTALPATLTDLEVAETGFSVALTAGNYWIGFVCLGTLGSAYEEPGVGVHRAASGAAYTPPPDPFPASSSGTRKYSCWGMVS